MPTMRLHKYLAHCDICSRRRAESLMQEGRVLVNGTPVTEPGTKIDPDKDTVKVDDIYVKGETRHTYIILNKPTGIISSAYEKDVRTVRDCVKVRGRIYPVGRLDKDSDGLIILTNDGALTERLTHPRYGHEKEYIVRVAHPLDDSIVPQLREGIILDGEKTQPAEVTRLSRHKLRIILREGRSRQIRRMCEEVGCVITRLTRVRIENISLEGMPIGGWRYLSKEERQELMRRIKVADTKRGLDVTD